MVYPGANWKGRKIIAIVLSLGLYLWLLPAIVKEDDIFSPFLEKA